MANSLCSGIDGHAGHVDLHAISFALRTLRSDAARARAWRPAILPDGKIAVFHGYFDNVAAIANELGAEESNAALLYGLAVERWGDEADRRIVGEYCAVIAQPELFSLRLSRSPIRAPPLCYSVSDRLAAVASVPRALFAAGVERRLNEARVADSALINFSNREASWFKDIQRVPTGFIVEIQRGRPSTRRQYYDLFASPQVRLRSDEDYIARAGALLDEGVRACLRGFSKPGATLSSGLDSPQVAVRALAAIPDQQRLPTFTFHPEAGYDGRVEEGKLGDERPFVEAFAAMHPRLEPHFTDNQGYGHDHRWADFFHLMGGAPAGLCNMYVFHGLFAGAKKEGCDVLLLAEWGNLTFSDQGDWGFVEYLLKGHWGQLWKALTGRPAGEGSLLKRFLSRCVAALLPRPIRRLARRIVLPGDKPVLELMQPLSPEFRARSGAQQRLKDSGVRFGEYYPWNRRQAQELQYSISDCEGDEIYQAFEQMYGVPQRDPTAYRPFVEFCFGLPVELFMRDGTTRWLAKEMAKGIMPEEQRANRLGGRWDSDWHLRIGRRRTEYLAELDRLAADERIGPMLDFPRLRAALEDWPEHTPTERSDYLGREFPVPSALLTARFIQYVEGHNRG